jgi:hypothetical protein
MTPPPRTARDRLVSFVYSLRAPDTLLTEEAHRLNNLIGRVIEQAIEAERTELYKVLALIKTEAQRRGLA